MKSSKERNKSKRSGYAVVESIMPSLIARAPAVRVEKHQNVVGKRVLDAEFENNAGLPCFWKEECDEMFEERKVKVESRKEMWSKTSARKDISQIPKLDEQKEDPNQVRRKHEPGVMADFRKDAVLSESNGIQPASLRMPLQSNAIKEKKQVTFRPPVEAEVTRDDDNHVTSNQTPLNSPKNDDEMNNFIESNNNFQSSGCFDSNSCSWKKYYDPSEYKEMPNLCETEVEEEFESDTFQWGKKYDPLQFKDKDEPGNRFTTKWKIINDMRF